MYTILTNNRASVEPRDVLDCPMAADVLEEMTGTSNDPLSIIEDRVRAQDSGVIE